MDGTDFEDLELLFGTGLAFAKNFFPLAPIMVFAQGFSINYRNETYKGNLLCIQYIILILI